jgi:DNA-directed RNA polymerase specialized sigma24 family protein
MSPLALRRYRAERLLREEFERLRGRVLVTVSGRLRASGVRLDASDLEACYALAWHGLYTAVLEGQEIANPTGWLVLVTFRRAIEEHRARARIERDSGGVDTVGGVPRAGDRRPPGARPLGAAHEYDLAAELDDRMRLRQLFEGLRGRLSARELQAAALCYLQGLSRSEAAARMGLSEARMRKLMEGAGPGRPGVAAKVGTLVETIRSGSWCEEQGSLMRGFAFGVLAPDGERYRLALIHNEECPACRAYVLALRGLAAVLPPVPCILHWALGAGAAAGAGAAGGGAATGAAAGPAAHAGAGVGASPGAGAGLGGGAAAPAGPAVGALSASGAAGASAAGGGWLLAGGPVGAKLAVGCLLALGVGAGCVALTEKGALPRAPHHRREAAHAAESSAPQVKLGAVSGPPVEPPPGVARTSDAPRAATASARALAAARRASREFGPEQASATGGERLATAGRAQPVAIAGSAPGTARVAAGSEVSPAAGAATAPAGSARARSAGASAAQREFAPG